MSSEINYKNGDAIQATTIAFVTISGVAIALRFLAKTSVQVGFGPDDWWILAGYFFYVLEQGLQYYGFHYGLEHPPNMVEFGRYLFISGLFYFITTTAVRIGILYYYRHIFSTPKFRRLTMVIIGICLLWCIPASIVEIAICVPVAATWDPTVKGNCVNYMLFYVIIMSLESVLDATVMVLPLREISHLQMATRRKILVSLIFLLGGFVIFTGIVRTALSYTASPHKLDVFVDCLWYNIHVGTAFLCACMPVYRPLFSRATEISQGFWSRLTSQQYSKQSSENTKESHVTPRPVLEDRRRSWYKQLEESYGENRNLVSETTKSAEYEFATRRSDQ